MKTRSLMPMLTMAVFLLGGLAIVGSAPAGAQCLSQSECDSLRAQLREFKDGMKSIRERAREIRRQAHDLPRGSDEWRALRRQAHELKRELRQTRRESRIRQVVRAYRAGCRNC